MIEYIKLLRVKHYCKNLLIFVPMFFGGDIFNLQSLRNGILGFCAFCMLSSAIYILNDYRDIEKDKKHPIKRNRPLASGKIRINVAISIMIVCLCISAMICIVLKNVSAGVCLILYFTLNVAYSMGLKNKPIIDIAILASGFIIRVFFGGFVAHITISKWLYLVVTAGSLYMGLGKRRNEFRKQIDTREVLKYYNLSFLDSNMCICISLTNVFYALWTIEMPDSRMSWTVPAFIIILMYYSFDTEGDSDGDPVEVIMHNKMLLTLISAYAFGVFILLYIL